MTPKPSLPSLLRTIHWSFWKVLSQAAAILLFDVRVYHLENVPRRGPFILAPNHESFLDPWMVGLSQPRVLFFLARESLFRIPGFGWFIWALNSLPVARESVAPRQGIKVATQALRSGNPLVLFPEGTRSEDGEMGALKRGVFLVAHQGNSPVVPAYVEGSFEVWPKGRRFPVRGPVRVYFGEAIWPQGAARRQEASRRVKPRANSFEKSSGDLIRLVEDGWFGASAKSPSVPQLTSETVTEMAIEISTGDLTGTELGAAAKRKSSKSSAVFFEKLGEAYRVLQAEAKKYCKGR